MNGNVVKNSWFFIPIKFRYLSNQSEEEIGSAGEQPTSNKIDE